MLLRSPAVVLNPGTAGVGIIHALSLGDVEIVTVGRNWPPLIGRFSRFPKQHFTYRPRDGESLADCLLRIADRFEGKGVLYPSIDVDLEAVVLQQEKLSQRYHVPATPGIGAKIFAKNWQYEIAERVNVPVPRHTHFIAGQGPDLTQYRLPLIIKPSSRTEAVGGRAFRLRVVRDSRELEECLHELAAEYRGREFQLAEDIPGEPTQLYTVGAYGNRDGHIIRTYTGRKISQRPYTHGDASVAETVTAPEEIVRFARALLEEAKFHGISQVEFKYDARDGQYRLIEINGRSWSWIKLAAFSGVNLPLIQYYDLTGDPRLAEALTAPQNDDYFFVRDALVKLNNLPLERKLIEDLRRRKTLVPAVHYDRDRRVGIAYRVATLLMSLWGGGDLTS